MNEQSLNALILSLDIAGLSKSDISFLLSEAADSFEEFPNWISDTTDPVKQKIKTNLDALLFYWCTEFDWCYQDQAWHSDYSDQEYILISEFIHKFPQSKHFRTHVAFPICTN